MICFYGFEISILKRTIGNNCHGFYHLISFVQHQWLFRGNLPFVSLTLPFSYKNFEGFMLVNIQGRGGLVLKERVQLQTFQPETCFYHFAHWHSYLQDLGPSIAPFTIFGIIIMLFCIYCAIVGPFFGQWSTRAIKEGDWFQMSKNKKSPFSSVCPIHLLKTLGGDPVYVQESLSRKGFNWKTHWVFLSKMKDIKL